MGDKINTLALARDWFLANRDGSITLVGKDGAEETVDCYPDAEAFFAAHGEA